MHRMLILAIALAACAPNQEQKGSRLKRQYETYYGTDGTVVASPVPSFTDVDLNITCSPVRWTDGEFYCLPQYTQATARFFYDMQCSQAVYGLSLAAAGPCGGQQSPDWVAVVTKSELCGKTTQVLIRQPARQTPKTLFSGDSGSCEPVIDALKNAYFLIDLGVDREFPISRFVKLDHQVTRDP